MLVDARSAAAAAAVQPAPILVVDDNQANLLAIETSLEGIGGDLVLARSGAEALRHLLERDFALILLDVQMPGMDGFETARLIRARERSRLTPIIFVTAYQRDDRETMAGYELGAVDFLFKPFQPAVLRAKTQVFVNLYERTAEVARKSALLAAAEAQEARERREAVAISAKADELARTVARLERTEAELLESNRRLSAADQRKDEFLAILGHELRNPLAPMVNALELLRARVAGDPVAAKAHGAMERQVEHLRRLVDDLLDLSRIDSGKIELRRERVELGRIVDDAAIMSRPLFEGRGQRLDIALPLTPIWLTVDPTRLVQVVANLLTNASRYSPEGTVTRVEGEVDRDVAVLRVSDEGKGIAPELLSRVFDSFVQAQSGGGGLGIGLAVARKLVERHGGTIAGSSAGPGLGTTFEIRLPIAGAGTSPLPRIVAPRAASLETGPLRVVLIEDSEDIRDTTCALLEQAGHVVATAADGPSGVALILDQQPDVALIDIGLPGFDGHEVAARVRGALGHGGVRLVAMTGFGQVGDRRRALDAGFDEHLTKPARAEQLYRALRG